MSFNPQKFFEHATYDAHFENTAAGEYLDNTKTEEVVYSSGVLTVTDGDGQVKHYDVIIKERS